MKVFDLSVNQVMHMNASTILCLKHMSQGKIYEMFDISFHLSQDGTPIQAYVAECQSQVVGVCVFRQEEVNVIACLTVCIFRFFIFQLESCNFLK